MARGGRLSGGIPGVDSIPVMAMAKEMFIQKPAVSVWDSALGAGFLDALNNPWSSAGKGIMAAMQGQRQSFPAIPAVSKTSFATGGRTTGAASTPYFGRVDIPIGGNTFQMMSEKSVYEAMKRAIVREQALGSN